MLNQPDPTDQIVFISVDKRTRSVVTFPLQLHREQACLLLEILHNNHFKESICISKELHKAFPSSLSESESMSIVGSVFYLGHWFLCFRWNVNFLPVLRRKNLKLKCVKRHSVTFNSLQMWDYFVLKFAYADHVCERETIDSKEITPNVSHLHNNIAMASSRHIQSAQKRSEKVPKQLKH